MYVRMYKQNARNMQVSCPQVSICLMQVDERLKEKALTWPQSRHGCFVLKCSTKACSLCRNACWWADSSQVLDIVSSKLWEVPQVAFSQEKLHVCMYLLETLGGKWRGKQCFHQTFIIIGCRGVEFKTLVSNPARILREGHYCTLHMYYCLVIISEYRLALHAIAFMGVQQPLKHW